MLPPQLKILGVGAVALGELLGFTAKKGEELAKFRNEVLLKEVTKITVYRPEFLKKAQRKFENAWDTEIGVNHSYA